jgi:hypothetical protein
MSEQAVSVLFSNGRWRQAPYRFLQPVRHVRLGLSCSFDLPPVKESPSHEQSEEGQCVGEKACAAA